MGEPIEGTVCWGHDSDVVEQYKMAFIEHWDGTGTIDNEGDAERLVLDTGNYMDALEAVHSGVELVTILKNKYGTGDASVVLKYKHGATEEDAVAASWNVYTEPFTSLGYVLARVEYPL
jgi:hypothetical protein